MCVFSPLVVAAVITVLLVAAHMLPLEWGAILGIALAVVLYVTDVYMLRDRFPTDSGDEGYTIKAMRRVLEGDAEYYSWRGGAGKPHTDPNGETPCSMCGLRRYASDVDPILALFLSEVQILL